MPAFRVHRLVESELSEARAWYADRSAIAGLNFALRFDATLARISERPTSHALVHKRREPENVIGTARDRLAHFE